MSERLPTNRVFLVRLSSGSAPATGVHRGRIEHIRSGRVERFSSLETLAQFIDEVLTAEDDSGNNSRLSVLPGGQSGSSDT